MVRPKALVLRTAGTNCDGETMHALRIAGAEPDTLHVTELLRDKKKLSQYQILVVPGGFSYGDDVAAGKILANELKFKLGPELKEFVARKKIVIGVCNGFQVLVKAGFLPAVEGLDFSQDATLTQNDSGRFQCEWVPMKREKSKAAWLKEMPARFELPIAHGEGKFVAKSGAALKELEKKGQVVFRYEGNNPNGSQNKIAGVCNAAGNVVGLMPHPERYVTHYQNPSWTRHSPEAKTPGYLFWKSAVNYAGSLS